VYILHYFAPPKKPNCFCLRRAVPEMCMWPFAPSKKTQIFFRLRQTVWKCVYGHLVRSKVLDRVFFTPQKKAMFHLCLIVCPILICPLSSYPLSPCLILCYLQLSWRTRDKSADFLSAPGGILCTKNTFFVAKIPKYSIPPPPIFFSPETLLFFFLNCFFYCRT